MRQKRQRICCQMRHAKRLPFIFSKIHRLQMPFFQDIMNIFFYAGIPLRDRYSIVVRSVPITGFLTDRKRYSITTRNECVRNVCAFIQHVAFQPGAGIAIKYIFARLPVMIAI